MRFSDQFEQRFSEMLTHYPTKRSVLVPTLLYAQDETGFLSDEVIAEIAGRLELSEVGREDLVPVARQRDERSLEPLPTASAEDEVSTVIGELSFINPGHQYCMYAARRRRAVRALREEAGHRTQRNYVGRRFLPRRSGMHWRLQLGTCGAGEL